MTIAVQVQPPLQRHKQSLDSGPILVCQNWT